MNLCTYQKWRLYHKKNEIKKTYVTKNVNKPWKADYDYNYLRDLLFFLQQFSMQYYQIFIKV